MSSFIFTLEPAKHWNAFCERHRALFHSSEWQSVLSQAFSSQTVYGWNPDADIGLAITVFQAGPFRIGYVGFPIGGTIGVNALEPDMILGWKRACFPVKVHCLRVPVSAFNSPIVLDLPAQQVPETAITKLQEWRTNRLPGSIGRNIKKAIRAGIEIKDATHLRHSDIVFRLYSETIERHGGTLRYNAAYFRALISLTRSNRRMRCLLATQNDTIAGFVIVALSGDIGYYLHGGLNRALQNYRPMDLLFSTAINWAQSEGMNSFNMMASPVGQNSLIRYKEKWGGTTFDQCTYDIPFHQLIYKTFLTLSTIHTKIGRILPFVR